MYLSKTTYSAGLPCCLAQMFWPRSLPLFISEPVHGSHLGGLIADDGEEEGERAATVALNFAASMKSAVVLLGVVEPASIQAEEKGLGVRDPSEVRRRLQERYERLLKLGHDLELKMSMEMREGEAGEQINAVAKREHADLVEVGRRHLSRFSRMLHGSTSDGVIRGAPCSMWII